MEMKNRNAVENCRIVLVPPTATINVLVIYLSLLKSLAKNKNAGALGFLSALLYLLLYSVQRKGRWWWIVSWLGLPAFSSGSAKGCFKLHCEFCLGVLLRCEVSLVGSVHTRQSSAAWSSLSLDLLCWQKWVSVVATKLHMMSASLWIYLLQISSSPHSPGMKRRYNQCNHQSVGV